ncbi:MAG: ribose 5-phosphate isomerase B [Ignavibacteria bacterium]|nr:MAG: ribose 5-phosphate isomerase B [Ignavibacteria bacterium]
MIALASDHGGFAYKEKTKALLDSLGLAWKDYGTDSEDSVDYPDFSHAAAIAITSGACERGIFFCGTGIGISLAANRHAGIRAASCQVPDAARMSRLHNDANVLALGQRLIDWETAEAMIRLWLETPFEGGRHERRIAKIEIDA